MKPVHIDILLIHKNCYLLVYKGRRLYPFCDAKHQSHVLGGWVGKSKFMMTFYVTKWLQRKSHFKRKSITNKNKKLLTMHVCFLFHHGTCTREVQVQGSLYFVISPRKKNLEILSLYRKIRVRENSYSNILYIFWGWVYRFSYALI